MLLPVGYMETPDCTQTHHHPLEQIITPYDVQHLVTRNCLLQLTRQVLTSLLCRLLSFFLCCQERPFAFACECRALFRINRGSGDTHVFLWAFLALKAGPNRSQHPLWLSTLYQTGPMPFANCILHLRGKAFKPPLARLNCRYFL